MKLKFFIGIPPVPWSRARSNRKTGAYFHAKPYAQFHRDVREMVKVLYKGEPLDCPLRVSCDFVFKPPKRRQFGSIHATKPDSDNLIKGVKDALEGILWVNDSRISELNVKKMYDMTGGASRIELTVETIEWKA